MLKSIYYFFRGLIPGSGLLRASVTYNRGVAQAERLHHETGNRYYLIWDPESRILRPITYHPHYGRRDSFKYLRQRGVFRPMSEKQFKEGSFYYTASKSGARQMDSKQQRIQLLRLRKHMRK